MGKKKTNDVGEHLIGYKFEGTQDSLNIGRLPGRRGYSLYCEDGEGSVPLAHFISVDAAALGIVMIKRLAVSTFVGKENE